MHVILYVRAFFLLGMSVLGAPSVPLLIKIQTQTKIVK